MEFLPNVKYVAEAIEGYMDCMSGAHSIGCASPIFEEGETYEVEIICNPYVLSSGELYIEFEARVLDGSLDGYDSPCGVWFSQPEAFNKYFRLKEAEEG